MSNSVIDSFNAPWQADPSGLWTLGSTAAASRYGSDARGLEIRSTSGAAPAPAPFAERQFAPAIDLRDSDELRLWLRSSRPGDGTPSRPFYLALEATRDPPVGAPWLRLLPVVAANNWELQRLWLGDMPAPLRRAVGFLRLRSLDGTIAFTAAVDDLIATAPRAIEDVDAALLARLDNVWSVPVAGAPTAVPAILDLPESPGTRTAPYVLVTPWSVTMLGHRGASGEVIDNYTTGGAHVRPAPVELQLEYRIDVYAQDRGQKSLLLDQILVDLLSPLVVDDVAFALIPFRPSQEEAADLITPGRTPLFYRLVVPVETGARVAYDQAVPFMVVGHVDNRAEAEALAL